jgi:hypothetical protein
MVRTRTLAMLAFTLILVSCAPTPIAAPVLPTSVVPSETLAPSINESYPTAAAAEPEASQTVSGFSLELRRAWRDGKQVNAEVCFTLPDASDWTVWEAHLEYGGTSVSEFSTSFLSKEEGQSGQPGRRCDQLSFYVPPDADLGAANLTIESVGAYPTADEYCTLYMPKIQQTLNDRGIGITLDCPAADGQLAMQIVGKPEGMSQEEAEQIVFSDEFYTIHGPWSFPVTFAP